MKCLEKLVKRLLDTQYLKVRNKTLPGLKNNCIDVSFLENGKELKQQLLKQYFSHSSDWCQSKNLDHENGFTENSNRLSFLSDNKFKDYFKNLNFSVRDIPQLIKRSVHSNQVPIIWNGTDNVAFELRVNESNCVTLVGEYLLSGLSGLEKFYSIQREHKIWWMRHSANPSRYLVEPIDLATLTEDQEIIKKCQSISIKSKFNLAEDSAIEMESITMVPLKGFINIEPDAPVTLVRSVINLDAITFAMILDATDNNRLNSLMLNRKVAPYQCAVAIDSQSNTNKNLPDLCKHLNYVLQRSNLRLFNNKKLSFNINEPLSEIVQRTDSIGIPYTLIIADNTLETGLLRLRSRDTTLCETIHISDIPKYLLDIFQH